MTGRTAPAALDPGAPGAMEPGVTVEVVPWDAPEVVALREEQQTEPRARYGGPEPGPTPTGRGTLAMVLVRLDGHPSACGAVQDITGDYDDLGPARTGEIKRVYVQPDARGRGISRLVMRTLHDAARTAGLERLVLETGMLQPEAIGLYETEGYTLIDNYGPYVTDPVSLCYAYPLA